ncbi:hypothetical protein BN85403670 [Alteracholeplasma palmae J233]|uniref:Uncharacterized protein n=1 Tax=Alteracholeplasma palmae (strain ATCC 49389 / J233) TaxID=1318466 RepID=U4KK16_ALTPJ|nr:hypothetical protein [Alteracholeplasma palmae]CCV63944.1 hypothetical protein BN85403670 [Alteracholeplasma palmae J233]
MKKFKLGMKIMMYIITIILLSFFILMIASQDYKQTEHLSGYIIFAYIGLMISFFPATIAYAVREASKIDEGTNIVAGDMIVLFIVAPYFGIKYIYTDIFRKK